MKTKQPRIIDGHNVSKLFDQTQKPHSFGDDHKNFIPKYGSIIYTVWDSKNKFIYVGIGGVGRKKNPRERILQHRSGRRSGDQFCTYIQDYYVLPEILKKSSYKPMKKRLDDKTKSYIREKLFYRFLILEDVDRTEVESIERQIKEGVFGFPSPILNGLPDSW